MSTRKTPKHTTGEIMRLLMTTRAAIAQLVASAPEVMHDAKGRLRCPNCKFKPTPEEHGWSEIDWSVTVNQGDVDGPGPGLYVDAVQFNQEDADRETLAFGCASCGQVVRFAESVDVLWG